ncbi:MAG: hypothetical protein R3Y63_14345 [Eubacteriales bacterium]
MNEFQAILHEGLNDIAREKKVSETFSPKVKEYLEILGFGKIKYVSLTENLCDSSRWHVLIQDVFTPYSYFPETDKLAMNTELDTKSHEERYNQLLKDVSGTPDSFTLASLYLFSTDGHIFEFCHNFIFDDGIDFENLRKNPCLALLTKEQQLFIDMAESLYRSDSTLSFQPKTIVAMAKEKVQQFCNALLIATGEAVETVDHSFSIESNLGGSLI